MDLLGPLAEPASMCITPYGMRQFAPLPVRAGRRVAAPPEHAAGVPFLADRSSIARHTGAGSAAPHPSPQLDAPARERSAQ